MKRFLQMLLVAVLLGNCGGQEQITLGQDNSGKEIFMAVGGKAVVNLTENTTTGYSWNFFVEPEQQDVIADISQAYKPGVISNGQVGAGGIKTYSFTAAQKGTVLLTGYYYRPWEPLNKETAEKVIYKIIVE